MTSYLCTIACYTCVNVLCGVSDEVDRTVEVGNLCSEIEDDDLLTRFESKRHFNLSVDKILRLSNEVALVTFASEKGKFDWFASWQI